MSGSPSVLISVSDWPIQYDFDEKDKERGAGKASCSSLFTRSEALPVVESGMRVGPGRHSQAALPQ
jgi:hypothetical protein